MRLSVVLDSVTVPAWTAEVVRRLLRNPRVTIKTISTTGANPARQSFSLSYRLYRRWDERRNRSISNPLATVDLTSDVAEIPAVPVENIDADVAVWLSQSQPPVVPGARLTHGILRFLPCDPGRKGTDPPYYWELFHREPVLGSAWELVTTGKKSVIAAEGFSATEIGWSLLQNQATPYAKAGALLEKSLYEISRASSTGELELSGGEQDGAEQPDAAQPDTRSLRVGSFIGKNFRRSIHRRIAYRGKEPYWFVAYRRDPQLFLARTGEFRKQGLEIIEPPEGSFLADPFVISRGGKTYIFVEDYPYREGKGVISVLEVGSDGKIGSAQRVLERPYHLSYPFVFEHDGSIYMIPETMGSRRIELYKATAFPAGWELVHLLKEDIDAVDTTLWIRDGIYYFFTNVAEPGTTPNDLLYLYLSDSLYGEWTPHPANPICADVRSSRNAGSLFLRDGKLIRPAQDCSLRYGYACQLNEVDTLSPTEYRERSVGRIEPDWYPGLIGTHTINSNETIEVIDGQIYRSR